MPLGGPLVPTVGPVTSGTLVPGGADVGAKVTSGVGSGLVGKGSVSVGRGGRVTSRVDRGGLLVRMG